jgi:hypothetical protein
VRLHVVPSSVIPLHVCGTSIFPSMGVAISFFFQKINFSFLLVAHMDDFGSEPVFVVSDTNSVLLNRGMVCPGMLYCGYFQEM